MSPRAQLSRMDVDTGWAYHHKVRKLQTAYPELWPLYWSAYLVLLAEAWRAGSRARTLTDAWCPALPCSLEDATDALRSARIIDANGRIPAASWRDWFGPAERRISVASERGQKAARARWGAKNADAMHEHSSSNAPYQPPIPSRPKRARAQRAGRERPESVAASFRQMGFYPPGEQPPAGEHHDE